MHGTVLLLLLIQRGDTIPAADSARRVMLPPVTTEVTRATASSHRLPFAVGVLDSTAFRRGQLTLGLDEALSRLPGVVVFNRYNYSLDQRISLRGAGSRANFGLRGVKVLVDGVPQTLPDGQSQLTNLDFAAIERVEVLTGPAAALYGNASGGVLSFSTETPLLPWSGRFRLAGGSFETWKGQASVAAARGPLRAAAHLSRFETGGFRQHSAAAAWLVGAKADLDLGRRSILGIRFSAAAAPQAEHPGALTTAEYEARRDSAAGSNLLRGADKSVSQQQASIRYRWFGPGGASLEAIGFGLLRDLDNPLATPPPAPPALTPRTGTYSTIDRRVGGFRVTGSLPLQKVAGTLRITAGVDLQAMRDVRRNLRSFGGRPVGSPFVNQVETVREVGPFAQVQWEPAPRVLVLAAARYDHLRFRVNDRIRSGGVDRGGERVMSSPSGSLGVSLELDRAATVYGNAATSFESPTTTELVNTSGSLGFNTTLEPQRTRALELGLKGRIGNLDYSLAGFANRIRDAIIQAREVDGRAFFENAGRVRTRGLESGLGFEPRPWLALRAAYTFASYRFAEYRIRNGATTDTLDGNRLAGVPRHFFRGALLVRPGPATLEIEQLTAGSVYGDDRNTLLVEGWGAGVTAVRLSGEWVWGSTVFRPFAAVLNLFDRKYVGSVNLNGAGGRVLEPAPGRNGYVGLEVGWR